MSVRLPKYRWPAGDSGLTRLERRRIRSYFGLAICTWVGVWVWLWLR